MRSFLKGIYHKNGGVIKHLRNRSVSVHEIQFPENNSPSIFIQFKRADIKNEDEKKSSIRNHFRNGAEFVGIPLSKEAALALAVLLDDYFKRVDKEFIKDFIPQEQK